jgi:hypothetical protein
MKKPRRGGLLAGAFDRFLPSVSGPVEPIVHADRDGADGDVRGKGSAVDVDSGADVRRPIAGKQRLVLEVIEVVFDEGRPVVVDHPLDAAADRPSTVLGVEDRRARKDGESADRRGPHIELGVDPGAAASDVEQSLGRPAGPAQTSGDTLEIPGPHADAAAAKGAGENPRARNVDRLNDPIVRVLTEPVDIRTQECALHADHKTASELVVAADLAAEHPAAAVEVSARGRAEDPENSSTGKCIELALGELVALPAPAHLAADEAAGPAPDRSRRWRLQDWRGQISRIARMADCESRDGNARQKQLFHSKAPGA